MRAALPAAEAEAEEAARRPAVEEAWPREAASFFSSLQAATKKSTKEKLASFALLVRVNISMHLRYAQDAPGDVRFLG